MNGFLKFTFHMDQERVTAISEHPVNDGRRHLAVFKRSKNVGTLQLDDLPPVFKEGSGTLFSFNTYGNIYIGKKCEKLLLANERRFSLEFFTIWDI